MNQLYRCTINGEERCRCLRRPSRPAHLERGGEAERPARGVRRGARRLAPALGSGAMAIALLEWDSVTLRD